MSLQKIFENMNALRCILAYSDMHFGLFFKDSKKITYATVQYYCTS